MTLGSLVRESVNSGVLFVGSMPRSALIFGTLLALYAAVFVLSADFHGWDSRFLIASIFLCGLLVALSTIDALTFRLPDLLNLALFCAGLLFTILASPESLAWNLSSAVVGFLALFGVSAIYKRFRGRAGLGLGDAKLYAGGGMWLGLEGLSSTLLVACLSALLAVGIALLSGQRFSSSTPLPFGPFLSLGIWTSWCYGPLL